MNRRARPPTSHPGSTLPEERLALLQARLQQFLFGRLRIEGDWVAHGAPPLSTNNQQQQHPTTNGEHRNDATPSAPSATTNRKSKGTKQQKLRTDATSSAASKISPAAFSSRCSIAGMEGISVGFGLPLPNNASAELGAPALTRADTAAAVAALRLRPTLSGCLRS